VLSIPKKKCPKPILCSQLKKMRKITICLFYLFCQKNVYFICHIFNFSERIVFVLSGCERILKNSNSKIYLYMSLVFAHCHRYRSPCLRIRQKKNLYAFITFFILKININEGKTWNCESLSHGHFQT